MVESKKEVKIETPVVEKTLDEVRQDKVREVFTKKAKGIKLSEEEVKIYDSIIDQAKQQQQQAYIERQKESYKAEQEQIKKESSKASEEDFLSVKAPSISLNKGPSAVQQWIAKYFATSTISKGKKKGGTFILKGYRDTGIELVWSAKPVRYVKFTIMNEKNEALEYVTRVVKTKHRWRGTSIPVHIALEGVNENVDLFEGAEVELSAEYVNKALTLQWNAGLLTGLAMRDEEAKDFFKAMGPLLMIITLLLTCIMAYMMYTMYQKMDAISLNDLHTIATTTKQIVDSNLITKVI